MKMLSKRQMTELVLYSPAHIARLEVAGLFPLRVFAPGNPLADRLCIIDPSDVEYLVALNLFDVGMERINQYSQLERENLINGVLELYDFVIGSLLDAGMPQKQSVIFRYIN